MVQNNEDEAVKWARKLVAELWRNSLSTVDFSYEIRKECREETGQFASRLAEELLYSAGSLQHFHTIALDCLQLLVHSEVCFSLNLGKIIIKDIRAVGREDIMHYFHYKSVK